MSTQEQDGCTELTCPQHGHANRAKKEGDRQCDTEGCVNLVAPWDVLCLGCWGEPERDPAVTTWDEIGKQVRG